MNLDDYAYNQDDRWYVNPQVALDEQNAFINNLRNLQAQDNAQITQQTRSLGTQVPSQLGGLVGGGGYFRSRLQTPQTNQTIANLRTAAQSQALQTLLYNELEKAKKKYKDAQNAATAGNVDPWSIINEGNDGKKYPTEYAGTVTEKLDAPYDLVNGVVGSGLLGVAGGALHSAGLDPLSMISPALAPLAWQILGYDWGKRK